MSVENEEVNEELVQEATKMGWAPQDKFKGNPEHWVDAETYVERGRQVLPILAANNKRLQAELLTRDEKLGTLESQLKSNQKALETLEKHYSEANKRAVETARQSLIGELKEARDSGDMDAEQKILGQLDDIRVAQREAAKAPEKKDPPSDESQNYNNQLSPDFRAWKAENPWFEVDKKKTKEFIRAAEDLRDDGNELKGVEFFEAVGEYLAKGKGEDEGTPASKVEGGSHGVGTRGGKGFNSLPSEARQACHSDAEDLVGPDKRYKTLKEWETAYAKIYYSV